VDIASVDGVLLPLAEARIPVTDDGLLRGDGVFEVMRLYDGVAFARENHLARMARSAENLRLALDIDEIARDVDALLARAKPGDGLLRIVATRGGHHVALIEPLRPMPRALTLGCVTFAPVRVLDGVKSLSYAANMLATRLARERGFDEALLVTPHSHVLELPTASFFWVVDSELRTPPLSEHLLDSITRQIVVELDVVHETVTTRADLESAEEAFVASSVYEVMAVSRIEEHELPTGGPVTQATARKMRTHVESELAAR
jgi:branched-chain amino acid aminotransferase